MRITTWIACVAAVAAIEGAAAAALEITSPAFKNNASIPMKYTCEGDGVNPALAFSGVPANTKSLALVIEDPDVPKSLMPSGVFDHWVLWDLPATSKGLGEGERKNEGVNGMGTGYIGPCPPDREHRYFFKLYALDTMLTGKKIASKDDLLAAMKGHIVQQAQLIGLYDKKNK